MYLPTSGSLQQIGTQGSGVEGIDAPVRASKYSGALLPDFRFDQESP
jgi:hypothetical protein